MIRRLWLRWFRPVRGICELGPWLCAHDCYALCRVRADRVMREMRDEHSE